MKSLKLTAVLLTCALFFFAACDKEKVTPDTVTPLNRTEILAQKIWQLDELQSSVNGTNTSYARGGSNTTGVPYDNIRIRFNADGTGTYTDETSVLHSMSWVFTSSDQRDATITLTGTNAAVFHWHMIELKDNYLHQTSPFNTNSLLTARYIQVP